MLLGQLSGSLPDPRVLDSVSVFLQQITRVKYKVIDITQKGPEVRLSGGTCK